MLDVKKELLLRNSESEVLAQGGVFMLFYERHDASDGTGVGRGRDEGIEGRRDSGTGSGEELAVKVESDGVDETLDTQNTSNVLSPPTTEIHESNDAQISAREDHELD